MAMMRAIREFWDAVVDAPRDLLDESGLWPRDLIPKMFVAATYAVCACFMAHRMPLSLEELSKAVVMYGIIVLLIVVFVGTLAGVLAAIMCIYEDMQPREPSVWERREAAELHDAQSCETIPTTPVASCSADEPGETKGERDVPGTEA